MQEETQDRIYDGMQCVGCGERCPVEVDQCCRCDRYYCAKCTITTEMREYISNDVKRVPQGDLTVNVGMLSGCTYCKNVSSQVCSICDKNVEHGGSQCKKCDKYYCNNCDRRVNWEHLFAPNTAPVMAGDRLVMCSRISNCVGCNSKESFDVLKARVIAQNDYTCVVCNKVQTAYDLFNHCMSCIRVWCGDRSKKYCDGHSYRTYSVEYGCGIDIDYKRYGSCGFCTTNIDVRERVADDTLKRLTVEETFLLSGLDHNVIVDAARANMLAGACVRPAKKRT